MIQMVNQLTNYLQTLSKKEFLQYLIAFLATVGLITFGAIYYVYYTSSSLSEQIKNLNISSNKIAYIVAKNEQLKIKEQKIRDLLNKNPNFTMNSYFERFYTKHKLIPEPNWKPEDGAIIEGTKEGIHFQEVILRATFKNQTMQTLVTILQDIYKEEIIYLKGLEVSQEGSKINFELTIATKQYKKETEEAEE